MKHIFKLIVMVLLVAVFPAIQTKAQSKEEITLTVSSDGATKDDALKNALRTAIEQAYGAFVSANTTILNDELVKDEIVTVSNGSIKDYKEISSFEKPDGSGYMMTVNATVSLPHLITYAKNHGSECEFAGNTFGMELKLFNLQKENELKALYNMIPVVEELCKTTMHWEIQVDEPKLVDFKFESSKSYDRFSTHGKIITSDVSFGYGDDFYLDTDVSFLINCPPEVKNGKASTDEDAIKFIRKIPDGQNALVRFKLSWVPNHGNNEVYDYISSTISSVALDRESRNKYEEQGHNLSIFYCEGENAYLRNSQETIDIWSDSLMVAINNIKNDFEFNDNSGQVSEFAPKELSNWVYRVGIDYIHTPFKQLEHISGKERVLKYFNTRPIYDYKKDYETPGMNDVPIVSKLNGLSKFSTYSQNRHGSQPARDNKFICIGGTGLFNKLFCIEYDGQLYRPIDTSSYSSWIVYLIIPMDEIVKYSSFKVVSK